VTDNLIVYNFADPTAGGTISGNILTLIYNTTSMDDADKLQIFYEDASAEQSISLDDFLLTLREILLEIASPSVVDNTLNRMRATTLIESGTITTVTTVTTVTNLTNLTNVDSYQGRLIAIGMDETAWATMCRPRIT
jgi:hypothetical protein